MPGRRLSEIRRRSRVRRLRAGHLQLTRHGVHHAMVELLNARHSTTRAESEGGQGNVGPRRLKEVYQPLRLRLRRCDNQQTLSA